MRFEVSIYLRRVLLPNQAYRLCSLTLTSLVCLAGGYTLPLAFSICLCQQLNSVGLCCCLLNGFVCFHPLCVWEGSPLILVILHGRQRLCCYLCALSCLLNNTIPTLSYCNFCSLTEAGSSGQLFSRHWRVREPHGTGRPRIPFP